MHRNTLFVSEAPGFTFFSDTLNGEKTSVISLGGKQKKLVEFMHKKLHDNMNIQLCAYTKYGFLKRGSAAHLLVAMQQASDRSPQGERVVTQAKGGGMSDQHSQTQKKAI